VRFRKRMSLRNYSGTPVEIKVDRTVRLLTAADVTTELGESPGSAVRTVAFESSNTVTNAGSAPWQPESGLVSIWILGMFTPSPETTIALPFAPGPEAELGPVVNDAYFGKVPADRLIVRGSTIFFRGDGQYRSKIGLSPSRARSIAGSYDAARRVLTLVQYTRPAEAFGYVNSMWEIQREPYKGDVINSRGSGHEREQPDICVREPVVAGCCHPRSTNSWLRPDARLRPQCACSSRQGLRNGNARKAGRHGRTRVGCSGAGCGVDAVVGGRVLADLDGGVRSLGRGDPGAGAGD
jgi:hypothetical protein